ncbi:amidohydrolase family protein [Frigoribacterium sp. CFBP 8754]|uniref:amidohydrolase n=1 Tax=Frigoribacterium sp. CFBP 8754 TaxID=2775290 RepID=UPI0017840159|nr:amidohydrolase family protein [Frigoribacterium sp. CFBP 8754]MBD8660025.1 amidohydrolase family protein [Frigoribacterium sp. CFBP 8754]
MSPEPEEARAVLLTNARLVGTDGSAPVDAFLDGGVVVELAPRGELASPVGAEVVDLEGRWLGPGLWDSHAHLDQWALVRRRLDVGGATSAAEAAALVGARLREAPPAPGEPLVGYGFRDALWPDQPHRALLDAVSGDVPVVLVSADLHAAWLDSAALAAHGHAGHETGLLREQDAFAVSTAVSAVSDAVLDGWVGDAVAAAAARGVVGVVDLEMSFSLDRWARRVRGGVDQLRVRCGVYPHDLEAAVERGLRTGDVVPGTRGLVTVGPAKIITDGSLNTRTAWCHDPYPGLSGPGASGVASYDQGDLVAWMRRASSAGLVPAVHAIGDRANERALDAFEAVGCRGSVEHAQLLDASDVARFAGLGVVASVQPEHAMDDRDVADALWVGRTDRAFALASLVAAGVELRLGSDAPVAPLDPWVTMAAAVSRSRDGRAAWHPEQRIGARAALLASVDGQGLVRARRVADLVVTEADPLAADDLRGFPVAATLVGGRFTHRTP